MKSIYKMYWLSWSYRCLDTLSSTRAPEEEEANRVTCSMKSASIPCWSALLENLSWAYTVISRSFPAVVGDSKVA